MAKSAVPMNTAFISRPRSKAAGEFHSPEETGQRGENAEDWRLNIDRRLVGVNGMDEGRAVVLEDWLGLVLVDLKALADGFEVGVVQPVFAQRASLERSTNLSGLSQVRLKAAWTIRVSFEHLGLVRGCAGFRSMHQEYRNLRIRSGPEGSEPGCFHARGGWCCRLIRNKLPQSWRYLMKSALAQLSMRRFRKTSPPARSGK